MYMPSPEKLARPIIKLVSRTTPFALQKMIAEQILPQAFSEALEDGDLDFLNQHFIELNIHDLQYRLTLTLINQKLCIVKPTTRPDVSIGGNLNEFIRLAARKEDPDTLFFQRRLTIEGDTEMGLEVKNLIDSIDMSSLPLWLQKSIHFADRVIPTTQSPTSQSPGNEKQHTH
jgi:O2-independent ubiquinone biosynthesis accessory factor UbiT